MQRILSFSPEALSEVTSVPHDPYRGFYHLFRYTLADDAPHADTTGVREYSLSLALLEINLRNYRNGPISGAALARLEAILQVWSQSEAQLMLRFLYDWDGIARATEPKNLSFVLTHMEQVGEIVNRYEAAVYLMQGIFIGNWGEMHGSYFSDTESIRTLAEHLHTVISPSIFLSVRTPAQWRTITGVRRIPTSLPAFSSQPSIAGRLGLFNDGMLGSRSDLGTYGDAPASGPFDKGTREEEISFQSRLCQFVPNGGEAVYDTPCSALSKAVSYFKAIHVSYLNADYDQTVLGKWRRTVWEGQDAFSGCDGLTYIEAHLGYRYTARRFTLRRVGFLRPRISLRLTLENTGFGNTLRPFAAAIVFQETSTGEKVHLPLSLDFRKLKSGRRMRLSASLRSGDLPHGTYQLFFSITDPATGRPVALANSSYCAENGLLLGRLDYEVDRQSRPPHNT